MKNKVQTGERVEAAMSSLEGMSNAVANPFLYGKIQHKMNLRSQQQADDKWFYRLAYTLLVLLLVNVYSYSSFLKEKPANKALPAIEAFAKDYGISGGGDNI